MPAQWYVVYTKPKNEGVALENLSNQGFEVYFPKAKLKKRRPTGLAVVIEALFPRYLFVRLEKGVHNFAKIRSTRGCVDLVKFGVEAQPVPDGLIEAFQSQHDEEGLFNFLAPAQIQPGTAVQIQAGPFEGLVGELCKYKSSERVLVLLDLVGKRNVVELDSNLLQSV
jgi:transcriptional antiterminator RfaH